MSKNASFGFATKILSAAGVAAILAGAAPALAVDPIIDPMRPSEGPTASAPRPAEREMKRDMESVRTPNISRTFGMPPVSGTIPSLLPPLPQQPILQSPAVGAPPPPALPPPQRARQPRDREG